MHEGEALRELYASIRPPVVVGIEATGSMGGFLRLLEKPVLECRVDHPTAIRKAETRRQKHDRRDAALLLQLLAEDRFPAIWMPSTELRDLPPITNFVVSPTHRRCGASARNWRPSRLAATGWSWSLIVVHVNRLRMRALSPSSDQSNTGFRLTRMSCSSRSSCTRGLP
jgi:hypothetical protein